MKKFALLGKNISYSLSPKLHKLILEKIEILGEYTLIDADELFNENLSFEKEESLIKNTIEKIRNNELQGINVTQPYKERVIKYLDIIDEVANKIGAVNTIVSSNKKVIGYNTDYLGVIESIKKLKIDISSKKTYILGTGGGSKSVAFAVESLGGIPVFVSRNKYGEKIINYSQLENLEIGDELLINCTPEEIPKNLMEKFKNIFTLNYKDENTLENKNLKDKNIIDGLYMLVVQGVKAQEIWQEKKIENCDEFFLKLQELKGEKWKK